MQNCFLCDGTEKLFKLISPAGEETPICSECVEDFYHYVNSGAAEEHRIATSQRVLPEISDSSLDIEKLKALIKENLSAAPVVYKSKDPIVDDSIRKKAKIRSPPVPAKPDDVPF